MRVFSTKDFKIELKQYVAKRNQRIAKRIYQRKLWNEPSRKLYRQNYFKTYHKEHYKPIKSRNSCLVITF